MWLRRSPVPGHGYVHAGVLPGGIRPLPEQCRRRHDSLPRPVARQLVLAIPPPPAVRAMRCGQIARRCRNRCSHPDTRRCHYAMKHTNARLVAVAPAQAAAVRHAWRGVNADAAGRRRARNPRQSRLGMSLQPRCDDRAGGGFLPHPTRATLLQHAHQSGNRQWLTAQRQLKHPSTKHAQDVSRPQRSRKRRYHRHVHRKPSAPVRSAVACPPQDCATSDRPPPVRK